MKILGFFLKLCFWKFLEITNIFIEGIMQYYYQLQQRDPNYIFSL